MSIDTRLFSTALSTTSIAPVKPVKLPSFFPVTFAPVHSIFEFWGVMAYAAAPLLTAADEADVSTGAATVACGLSLAGLSQPAAPTIDDDRASAKRRDERVMGDSLKNR